MICGIGVDIAEIKRYDRMLRRYGERFTRRILTEREFERFLQRNRSSRFLASRFAAKEATAKALGCGIAGGVTFQSIEVTSDDNGKPGLVLHGEALARVQHLGVTRSMLTLSDERHYAVAMVVLERD